MRTLGELKLTIRHDVNNDPTTWVAEFVHADSVKTHDKVKDELVLTTITPTEGYTAASGIRDTAVLEIKAWVTNSGAYAGGTQYDGVYDSETWV